MKLALNPQQEKNKSLLKSAEQSAERLRDEDLGKLQLPLGQAFV